MRRRVIPSLTAAVLLLLPCAGLADRYQIDPAHTSLTFSVRHFGISNVKGHFDEFSGSIVLENGAIREASGTIQVNSINTGVWQRDDHLRTADFFDAPNYPQILFKTGRVEKSGEETVLVGDFTMRGVTRELRLPVRLNGPIKDPKGNLRIGLEAKTGLNRKDYGIRYHAALETGVPLVGDEVAIEINAEAIKEVPGETGTQ